MNITILYRIYRYLKSPIAGLQGLCKRAKDRIIFLRHRYDLSPLSPDSTVKENIYYAKTVRKAIRNKNIKNIALSGSYCSGKSSIIAKLSSGPVGLLWKIKNKPHIISFMTLNLPMHEKNTDINQATSPKDAETNTSQAIDTKTAEKTHLKIQQEFFKSLFYGEKPDTLSSSRYGRNGRMSTRACFVLSSIFGIPLAYWLASFLGLSFFQNTYSTEWYDWMVALIISIVCSYVLKLLIAKLLQIFYGIRIKNLQFSGMGVASLSTELADKKKTLDFDSFLDEIIYYFRRTKRKVIIIEDIDRFEDPLIYEEIHHLNLLINNSKLRQKVTFIYAMRDSLIPEPEKRSKLFDLEIAIVPFMSADSKIEFARTIFHKAGFKITPNHAIIRIVAKYSANARVIKATCNTASIIKYASSESHNIPLSQDEIIAIALIRILYPYEYENMIIGQGKIDELFKSCLNRQKSKTEILENKLSPEKYMVNCLNANDSAIQKLWKKLSSTNGFEPNYQSLQLTWNGTTFDKNSIKQDVFWKSLVTDGSIKIKNKMGYIYNACNIKSLERKLSLDEVKALDPTFGEIIDTYQKPKESFVQKINEIKQENKFTEYQKDDDAIIKYPILQDLIDENILDGNYRLFLTSPSCSCSNFNLNLFKSNYLSVDKADFNYSLADEEINELFNNYVLPSDLSSMALINESIFRYLFEKNIQKLDVIIEKASRHSSQLLAFYDFVYHKYQEELNANYGDTIDGSIINKGSLSSYTDEDFILSLTKIIAKYYPLKLLSNIIHLPDNQAKEAIFIIATINSHNLTLSSANTTTRNLLINQLHYYEDSIARNDSEQKLPDIYIHNHIQIKSLINFKHDSKAYQKIIDNHLFKINKESITLLGISSIISELQNRQITADDFTAIFRHLSSIELINFCKENLISLMRQAISQNANSANDITSISVNFLKEHNYRLSIDQLLDIKNTLDTEQLLALVNQAKLTLSELLQILPEMDSPYCDILSQSNISIKNTYNSKKFIKRLFLFGIIKTYSIGNGKIEIAIKE